MKITALMKQLDEIAPFSTAASWDNSGLLIGDANGEVDTVLLATDCTDRTLQFAAEQGAQLILAHHPLIFNGLKRLPADSIPYQLAARGIAMIGYHTNWDRAAGGVDDTLAQLCGLFDPAVLTEEGYGRIGALETPQRAAELASRLKELLPAAPVRLYGNPDRVIHLAASLCGSGDDDLNAVLDAKADCCIAGELKYHTVIDLLRAGIPVILLGHGESERPAMARLQTLLAEKNPELLFLMDDRDYELTLL